MKWVDIIEETALADGEHICVDINGLSVVLFKMNNNFYALEDVCSHDGGEIASGMLDGGDIICPRHGARFCIKTGAVKSPPAYEAIARFDVRVEKGMVQINDND